MVIFPKSRWSGVFKVRNFDSRIKFVRKIFVSGVSWSKRTNSGMVKQKELWRNLSVSICNILIIAMSDLDETFRKHFPDISFGIAITIQNKIRMIRSKVETQ